MSDTIEKPWTQEQADALNRFQHFGGMHPFTCGSGNRTDAAHLDGEGVLFATPNGWICPYCDYRQNWAHDFMQLGRMARRASATGDKMNPLCECGHDLFSHYMCATPEKSRCFSCQCKQFKRSWKAANADQPQRTVIAGQGPGIPRTTANEHVDDKDSKFGLIRAHGGSGEL